MTQYQNLVLSTISTICLLSQCVSAHPYKALVAPITKDDTTSLYSLTLNFHEKYVIDLGGPFIWSHCPKHYHPISCSSPKCPRAPQSYHSPVCPSFKPIVLTRKDVIIWWTDGRTPVVSFNFKHLYVTCAPKSLLTCLPIGSSGMAGLSPSPLALSMQLTLSIVKRQFSVCLPGTNASPGVAFFGDGPFNMMPPTDFDVRSILSYTPLVQKHSTSPSYYIDLKAISINGKPVFMFDSIGHGGVKLTTLESYTKLTTHIYTPLYKQFAWETRGIPRANKVKPFEFCLNTTNLGSTRVGLAMPQIDLELVNQDVACLAIIDGGATTEEAVVIGSYQMENNFLLFDINESKLGSVLPCSFLGPHVATSILHHRLDFTGCFLIISLSSLLQRHVMNLVLG